MEVLMKQKRAIIYAIIFNCMGLNMYAMPARQRKGYFS